VNDLVRQIMQASHEAHGGPCWTSKRRGTYVAQAITGIAARNLAPIIGRSRAATYKACAETARRLRSDPDEVAVVQPLMEAFLEHAR
jgi:hypothetical protein